MLYFNSPALTKSFEFLEALKDFLHNSITDELEKSNNSKKSFPVITKSLFLGRFVFIISSITSLCYNFIAIDKGVLLFLSKW